ncbi:hypothetical protein [Bacteriovorax sp. Seq25_V]|uniref:hypothetical protein n=1 Tax=Bacteriovorax sp. Seq25_V TaxID=1201288 RepID=UPI000389F8B1|nr:hypothetical protein [Bacteriovorax sp. Seq25_V]EQC46682.1 hypothetical protein M900_2413 [Bacteriovorax sp. Seq25_V]
MKYLLLLSLVTSTHAAQTKPKILSCHSSKEFITAYNFLKSKTELKLEDKKIHSIALKVSAGCTNSAKRFLKVFETLTRAEVDSRSSLEYAKKYSNMSDNSTEAFLTIFKETFLKDFLDLDIKTSLSLADKITTDDDKNIKTTKEDFQQIVKFCKKSSGLELNGKKCSELALEVLNSSVKYKTSIYKVFEDSFKFLTNQTTVNLPSYQAIDIAKKISSYGPKAFENFKETYQFLNKKELYSKDRKYLLDSALEVTMNSTKEGP